MQHPRLLHFRISHYNEKVRWALDFKGWPHERRALTPGLHIPSARLASGQNMVPILVLDGEAHIGSSHILREIERRRPEPRLFPEDPERRSRALALERYFDDEVAPDLRRLFWWSYLERPDLLAAMATNQAPAPLQRLYRLIVPVLKIALTKKIGLSPDQIESARRNLPKYCDRIVEELGPSGYLAGERFSVADLAVASIMSGIVRPPEFPYPLPEPRAPALVDLQGAVREHPGFQWVCDTYARHRGTSCEV